MCKYDVLLIRRIQKCTEVLLFSWCLLYVLYGLAVSMSLVGYTTYGVIGLILVLNRYFCLDCKKFSLRYFAEDIKDGYTAPINFRYCKRCKMAQMFDDYKPYGNRSVGPFSEWKLTKTGNFSGRSYYH